MKTKLPVKSKSHEPVIFEIRDIILENYKNKISHIILFGSFARGNWVYDYYHENGHDLEYASDYDFLILTKKPKNGSGHQATKLKNEISKKLKEFKRPYKSHTPTIIVESLALVNKELEKGRYFFSDIKKEGILLFQEEDFALSEPKELNNEEIKEIAQDEFSHWLNRGESFFRQCEHALRDEDYKTSAFELHQASESFLNCSLLVLTGYKPKTHNLEDLLSLCCSQNNQFLNIFPVGNKEQEDCFELLKKAYVDARYIKDYEITLSQLNYLIEKVMKLKEITKTVCEERIKLLD